MSKFKPNDKVYCKKYGKGFCHQVNESDKDWMYDFHFEDGIRIWMSEKRAEKDVKFQN